MLADPLARPQSSAPYACPEVTRFLLHVTAELFDEISFPAQDIWSLGCLLVWLVTGEDPFAWREEDSDFHNVGQMECMCMKHTAWVSSSSTPHACYALCA